MDDVILLTPRLKHLAKYRADGQLYEVVEFQSNGYGVPYRPGHPEWARLAREAGPVPAQE